MSTKSKALKLAAELDDFNSRLDRQTAAELRRLHAINVELLEALRLIFDYHTTSKPWNAKEGDMSAWIKSARAAIAKATGETT